MDQDLTHEEHQQMIRRAEGPGAPWPDRRTGRAREWLVHQWLATRQSVWRDSAAGGCCQHGARLLERDAPGPGTRRDPRDHRDQP